MTPAEMAALHARSFTTPRPWSEAEIADLLASPLVDRSLSRRITLPNGWLRLRWQMASGLGLTTLILATLTA